MTVARVVSDWRELQASTKNTRHVQLLSSIWSSSCCKWALLFGLGKVEIMTSPEEIAIYVARLDHRYPFGLFVLEVRRQCMEGARSECMCVPLLPGGLTKNGEKNSEYLFRYCC